MTSDSSISRWIGRNGGAEPREARNPVALARSRLRAPTRWRPGRPASRARQTDLPIVPSPTTPTRSISEIRVCPGRGRGAPPPLPEGDRQRGRREEEEETRDGAG